MRTTDNARIWRQLVRRDVYDANVLDQNNQSIKAVPGLTEIASQRAAERRIINATSSKTVIYAALIGKLLASGAESERLGSRRGLRVH
jgi:hypothetical protein